MSDEMPHRSKPCSECPWRLDVPAGKFPPHRYVALASTAGSPGAEVPLDGKWFACHRSADGAPIACAGWLAVVGRDHIGVRLALAMRQLPATVLTPRRGWPALYPTYEAMAKANGVDG